MPYGLIILALQVFCVIHAAKTGRFWPWAYVILLLPGVGAIAYILLELAPEWLGTHQAHTARRKIGKALNPEKTYRALRDQVDIAVPRHALAQAPAHRQAAEPDIGQRHRLHRDVGMVGAVAERVMHRADQ